jgi:acetyltransferase-like isoleucine patch superfamily enzyme
MAHSHVGHDAIIEEGCELAPGVVVGGFAWLKKNVRVGMNATIRNRVTIGEGARIGMGSVVTKDVPAGETWIGSPARNIQTDPRIDPLWDEWWSDRMSA